MKEIRMKLWYLLAIGLVGCLPVQPRSVISPSISASISASPSNKCQVDSTLHGIGVVSASVATVASVALGFTAVEVSQNQKAWSDAGLVAGGVGLLGVGLVVLGALEYAADGCASSAGPLPLLTAP
jgi:hypothetical protein